MQTFGPCSMPSELFRQIEKLEGQTRAWGLAGRVGGHLKPLGKRRRKERLRTLARAADGRDGELLVYIRRVSAVPTYEYRCTKCNKSFSVTHSITEHEKAKVACPKCNSGEVERTITTFFAKTSKKS